MARYEFKLPDIGEGVAEGEIVSWLVHPGDVVREDQPMVEIMTDKATVVIGAPKAGKILELRGAEGAVVQVHSVLVVFDVDGAPGATIASSPAGGTNGAAHPAEPAATAVGDIREDLPGMKAAAAARASRERAPGVGRPLATPATRQLARNLGLDLAAVTPTGPGGRVTSDDVRAALQRQEAKETPHARSLGHDLEHPRRPVPRGPQPDEERAPVRGLRKRIFEHMAHATREAAHFTFVEECNVTRLKGLRERLKPAADAAGVKLSFLPFILKSVAAALRLHPALNSTFDDDTQEIVTRRAIHIGVATATDKGLVVPVVKDVQSRSILDVAREIARLSDEARAGKARLEDLQGSTFTVTSLGQQGGLFATPIINYPEVAILGVHQMKRKPVVMNEQIVIGDVMLLSLSFDHRLIDGHVGAAFAYEVIGYLENPEKLMLEMA